MKIYLLERSERKAQALREAFAKEDVEVVCDEFENFMRTHEVECVVSPANAFGLMEGGYDAAITAWFGEQLPKRVQRYILENYYGERPSVRAS